ncbi:hypothetical protein CRUP_021160 [Coryphaenoides rupestris]|nr:hypothetical protein CRUP_021160 [Coryphaenoides rupestris]
MRPGRGEEEAAMAMAGVSRQSHPAPGSGDREARSAREPASEEEQAEHRSQWDSCRPSSLASELERLRGEGTVRPARRVRASISSARRRTRPAAAPPPSTLSTLSLLELRVSSSGSEPRGEEAPLLPAGGAGPTERAGGRGDAGWLPRKRYSCCSSSSSSSSEWRELLQEEEQEEEEEQQEEEEEEEEEEAEEEEGGLQAGCRKSSVMAEGFSGPGWGQGKAERPEQERLAPPPWAEAADKDGGDECLRGRWVGGASSSSSASRSTSSISMNTLSTLSSGAGPRTGVDGSLSNAESDSRRNPGARPGVRREEGDAAPPLTDPSSGARPGVRREEGDPVPPPPPPPQSPSSGARWQHWDDPWWPSVDISQMPSYSASCLMKAALGRVMLRRCLTKL